MAYKTVTDLSADVTISLGGFNKKAKKDNPTSIEGYFLGTKQVADNKKKSGVSNIYFFQTSDGNIGVWGKTDMDNKLVGVKPGAMVRVSFDRMVPTPNGPMYKYKVEVDEDNIIEVSESAQQSFQDTSDLDNEEEADETSESEEETYFSGISKSSATAAATVRQSNQTRTQELLNRGKSKVK